MTSFTSHKPAEPSPCPGTVRSTKSWPERFFVISRLDLRLLNRRCGPLTDATTAQIQALPLGQLEALADALLDFTGPDDLATWLAANA
jgi:hypothetical protein